MRKMEINVKIAGRGKNNYVKYNKNCASVPSNIFAALIFYFFFKVFI